MNADQRRWQLVRGFNRAALLSPLLHLCLSAFICGPLLSAAAAPGIAKPQTAPNVVLIMTDDMGYGDVHSHGNDKIDTPVLDRLAADGARFERFFVQPVCSPTRAGLLSGRYHPRLGVHGVTRAEETMRADTVTIAEIFRNNGYATGCFGKWHNGAHYPHDPNGQGFNEFLGFCGGHWNNYFDTELQHNDRMVRTKGFIIDVITDAAMAWIEAQAKADEPFFCYIPYNTPHSPFQVPDAYFGKHKQRGFDDTLACVYGMVENVDVNVGRVLTKLDELKLADNTVVLFLTDNGANTDRFNAEMKGRKGSVDEGGSRVPLFVRWSGHVAPGTVVTQIATHVDIAPTLIELCGLQISQPPAFDGLSLAPLLSGKAQNWPDRAIFNHWGNRGAIRTQRWRATTSGKKWQLYDMLADPSQTKDVADDNADVLADLRGQYETWWKNVSREGFDPVPAEIGHAERGTVTLPGHEAHLNPAKGKGISYDGNSGWANDWVTNWTSIEAYPAWPVRIVAPGRYEVTLMYAAPASSIGTKIAVEVGDRRVEGEVREAYAGAVVPSPDRVKRKEVYERQWKPLMLGVIELPAGAAELRVRALSKPGATVMDLKAVELKRVN